MTSVSKLICNECTLPIEPKKFDSVTPDLTYDDEGRSYHWSCLQEYYERNRLADEREANED